MKAWVIAPVAIGLLAVASIAMPTSCAREPQFKLLPIGQTVTIKPMIVGRSAPAESNFKDFKAIHLTASAGGRFMTSEKGNPILKFYKGDSQEPDFQVAFGDLETAYETTGCTNDMIATLDGPLQGQVLVCDGSLGNFEEYVFIKAVNSKGRERLATSWSTYKINDDVLGVIIQFY